MTQEETKQREQEETKNGQYRTKRTESKWTRSFSKGVDTQISYGTKRDAKENTALQLARRPQRRARNIKPRRVGSTRIMGTGAATSVRRSVTLDTEKPKPNQLLRQHRNRNESRKKRIERISHVAKMSTQERLTSAITNHRPTDKTTILEDKTTPHTER